MEIQNTKILEGKKVIGGVWNGATIAKQWDNVQENTNFHNIIDTEGNEIFQTFLPPHQKIEFAEVQF